MKCLLLNCRNPVVCGVSSLGIDHTSILGDTLDKIAWHKAGIFKVREINDNRRLLKRQLNTFYGL